MDRADSRRRERFAFGMPRPRQIVEKGFYTMSFDVIPRQGLQSGLIYLSFLSEVVFMNFNAFCADRGRHTHSIGFQ